VSRFWPTEFGAAFELCLRRAQPEIVYWHVMIGRRLLHYDILDKLGQGGMGVVYKARDTRLDRLVAIKVLPGAKMADPERNARFLQEARAASALNHPNIITIYDFAQAEGMSFLVMEFVPGKTLDALVTPKGLRVRQVLALGAQVADGIHRAHAAGIVHRDLKPSNIIVSDDGHAKILDFGLAKLSEPAREIGETDDTLSMAQSKTQEGTILGTASYMSPEQAEGRRVDARSDVFSFGCVLYEMVCGQRAFAGASLISTMAAILNKEPVPASQLTPECPRELERLIQRCLRKDPEKRLQNMGDMRMALEELEQELNAAPVTEPARTAKPRRRRMPWSAVAIGVLAFSSAWLGYRAYVFRSEAPVAQPQLRRVTWEPGLQMQPTWSPDGKFLAFSSNQSGNFDIWVQPVGEGNAVQVTRTPEDEFEPDWSPDGQGIVFQRAGANGGLFVTPALGGKEQRLSSFGSHPLWSPDGKLVLFQQTDRFTVEADSSAYFTVSLEGEPPKRLPDTVVGSDKRSGLAWHPDGKRISMLREDIGSGSPIFRTVNLDGSGAVQVETGLEPLQGGVRFRWSHQGDEILIERPRRGYLARVAVDPRTMRWKTAPQSLTLGDAMASDPAPETQGRRVALTLHHDRFRIWSVPLDSRGMPVTAKGFPITPADWDITGFDLAPRARRIGYRKQLGGNTTLWLQDVTGARPQALPLAEGTSTVLWSPDGESIAASRSRRGKKGTEETWEIVHLGRSVRQQVLPWSDAYYRFDDWSRDGSKMLGSRNGVTRNEEHSAIVELPANAGAESDQAQDLLTDTEHNLWQVRYSPNGRYIVFNAVRRGDGNVSTLGLIPAAGKAASWVRLTDGKFWDDKPIWSDDGKWIYFYSDRSQWYNIWRMPFDPAQGRVTGPPLQVTDYHDRALMLSPVVSGTDWRMRGGYLFLPLMESTGAVWVLER
jgi:eukaryotic-like serine/threonine-protein kinase